MSQLWEQVYNFVATLSPGIKFLIGGVVILIGIGFIAPSKKAKEWSKEQILSVIVGAILVLGGLAFAADITSSFNCHYETANHASKSIKSWQQA